MTGDLVTHSMHQAVLLTGVLILVFSALHDIAARTIPNTACAALALLGVAVHLADGQILFSLILGAIVFAACTFCWLRGWMGGGDVKLFTAAALFVPPAAVGTMDHFPCCCESRTFSPLKAISNPPTPVRNTSDLRFDKSNLCKVMLSWPLNAAWTTGVSW